MLRLMKSDSHMYNFSSLTDSFPLAGQNLYEIRSSSKFKWNSFTDAINYFMDRWFNEHTNADMNVIDRYRSNGFVALNEKLYLKLKKKNLKF